jgi:hypothetical protein
VRSVDSSLLHGGIWQKAFVDVQDSIPDERVEFDSDKHMTKAGNAWEAQGFKVLAMRKPQRYTGTVPFTEPDMKRFIIWSYLTRRPIVHRIEAPDEAVPALLGQGMVLTS